MATVLWHLFRALSIAGRYSQQPTQQSIPYLLIDANKPFADVIITLRFAWPNLPNNSSNDDATMRGAFEAVRRSVTGGLGVPEPREGEVIRRSAQ